MAHGAVGGTLLKQPIHGASQRDVTAVDKGLDSVGDVVVQFQCARDICRDIRVSPLQQSEANLEVVGDGAHAANALRRSSAASFPAHEPMYPVSVTAPSLAATPTALVSTSGS